MGHARGNQNTFQDSIGNGQIRVAVHMGDMPAEAETLIKRDLAHEEVRLALSLDDTPADAGTNSRAGVKHTDVTVAHEWYTL